MIETSEPERTNAIEPPGEENGYHAEHAALVAASFRRWTGRELIELAGQGAGIGRPLFEAPFALVSHGTESDPIFNYGNRCALQLFEMGWEEFTKLPSRMSAEPVHRDERQRLMDRVKSHGFIDDYRGVRISKDGRRFLIEKAVVWNLVDEFDVVHGQAAMFSDWRDLESAAPKSPRETPFERERNGFVISSDPSRIDFDTVCEFFARSYWANKRTVVQSRRALDNSLCFGIYRTNEEPGGSAPLQVGFARVVTDYSTFAWLCDVFVAEEYRAQALGKWLIESILEHPELQGLRRWMLATADAHGLYAQFGFLPLASVERWMERYNP